MVISTSQGEDLQSLINRNDHLGILRLARTHKVRKPELVIRHGKALLFDNRGLIRSESILGISSNESQRLAVLEQVCEAALDVHDRDLTEQCLSLIEKDIGGEVAAKESTRFRRLLGLCLESSEDYSAAEQLYDDMLKKNLANSYALKRKYCILKAQVGREADAAEALNSYLERNQGDASAWLEMANSCLDCGDYKSAAYCFEELVMTDPLDSSLHCRLGELYATCGGLSNLLLARKHLCQSLDLSPPEGNLRALYALISTASAYLDEARGATRKGKKEACDDDIEVANELLKYGAEKCIELYKGTGMSDIVGRVVESHLDNA